jgi:hypothetical protein
VYDFCGRYCNDGGKMGRNYHPDDALEQIKQSEYGAQDTYFVNKKEEILH